MKSFYVYIITNLITKRQYVGSKVCYESDPYNDGYMGSSKYLKKDYVIYGKENFDKKIISTEYNNEADMLIGESFYIHKYKTLEPNGYNRFDPIVRKGFHMNECHHSEKTKQQISISSIGKNKGRKLTEEHKKKISENNGKGMLGKHQSEEAKEKLRLKNLGKTVSEETKEKIHLSTKGIKKLSEETKQKMRKPKSDETKQKMKIAQLKRRGYSA